MCCQLTVTAHRLLVSFYSSLFFLFFNSFFRQRRHTAWTNAFHCFLSCTHFPLSVVVVGLLANPFFLSSLFFIFDTAPTRGNPYEVLLNVSRMNVTRHFLLNGLLLSGIVCHLPSLILKVCHPPRELSITLMWIYLHDIDVLCGFIICIVNLFIFIACVFFCSYCYTAYAMCQWSTDLYHK